MSIQFDYFYGCEAEQFTFYRIPKMLFKDKTFKNISAEAKILYGLMLDRMSLSVKNMWLDDNNRVYIIYTLEDIIDDFGCARQKAAKLLDELDKGVGLIERKRQGLGKPNIIYVKNFVYQREIPENYRSMKTENQEVWKSNLQKYENHTSRSMNMELQEVWKSYPNNTDNNYTDYNENNNNDTEFSDTEITSYPILPPFPVKSGDKKPDTIRWIEEHRTYENIIKDNIEYDILLEQYKKEWLDEIVAIMVDVVCSTEPFIRINKQEYPKEVVKSRFLKINSTHIEYIYLSLKDNSSNVRNIRAFLITTIYRAFETADNWFSARVQYDMKQGGF